MKASDSLPRRTRTVGHNSKESSLSVTRELSRGKSHRSSKSIKFKSNLEGFKKREKERIDQANLRLAGRMASVKSCLNRHTLLNQADKYATFKSKQNRDSNKISPADRLLIEKMKDMKVPLRYQKRLHDGPTFQYVGCVE